MFTKFLAAKSILAGVATVGTLAAGATVAVTADDAPVDETTTTVVDDTTTTVVDDTTTSTSVPEETTTTTTTIVDDTTTTTSVPEETTTTTAPEPAPVEFERGPDPNGPAKFGLCNAFGRRESGPGNSQAAANLRAAAEAAGQSVEEFCEDARPGGRADDSGESELDEPAEAHDAAESERPARVRGNGNGNGGGRGRNK